MAGRIKRAFQSKRRRVKAKAARRGIKFRAFARSTKNPIKFTRRLI